MSPELHAELAELQERWRQRAVRFSREANMPNCQRADVMRLTAMASTLEWAAADLSVVAQGC